MTRTITPVLGNSQKLDGGSMYGNCPKAVWSRWSPPDALDRIDLGPRHAALQHDDQRPRLRPARRRLFRPLLPA